jgi:AcrR family transcriptional regulator
VDVIARKAGVNKAALYYHIGDKKALYAEVIHGVLGTAAERLARGMEDAATPEDKVRTYIRTLARSFDENPQMPRIMMREMASGGRNLPGVFFQDLLGLFRTLSSVLKEGEGRGVFEGTMPFVVHFMTIGAAICCKTVIPLIAATGQASDELKNMGGDVWGTAVPEIEKLVLKAIRAGEDCAVPARQTRRRT